MMTDIVDHLRRAIAAVRACSGRSYDEMLDCVDAVEREFAVLRSMQHLLKDVVVSHEDKAEQFQLIAELQSVCDQLPEQIRGVIRQAALYTPSEEIGTPSRDAHGRTRMAGQTPSLDRGRHD